MLEKIDLNQRLDKKEYKSKIKELGLKLKDLAQQAKELKIPVTIIFEGWSASGKGTQISRVLYPLDPRDFNVYPMNKVTEESYMRPYLWSYFTKTPSKGRFTILDKSWHRAALPEGVEKWKLSDKERAGFYYDMNAFEEQLISDGNVIIKFFLHISKEEQKKRFDELLKNSDTKWRVDEKDFEQNKNYNKYLELFENMIQQTNTGNSRWCIIESNDRHFASVKIFSIIINKLEAEIERRKRIIPQEKSTIESEAGISQVSILSSVDLNKEIADDEYKHKLEIYQKKIKELGYKLYSKRKSVIIVYEGWDAAGKGGNIKRVTEEIDPRGYEVVPIAAPTAEELSHHYLWRFWRKLPKDGHMAIFDRSWYGRVMVERVEQFCKPEEWQRAYKEINDMELHFHNHGCIIFKFWLQIDKDEQLKRFQIRQQDPLKQYKITDEDWRNREKWDLYENAVNEMLFRTDTEYAHWNIIESNNKKYARIKVLEHIVQELEKKLL